MSGCIGCGTECPGGGAWVAGEGPFCGMCKTLPAGFRKAPKPIPPKPTPRPLTDAERRLVEAVDRYYSKPSASHSALDGVFQAAVRLANRLREEGRCG